MAAVAGLDADPGIVDEHGEIAVLSDQSRWGTKPVNRLARQFGPLKGSFPHFL